MPKSLPASPSLVHLKDQAKKLLKAHQSKDISACSALKLLHGFSKFTDDEIFNAEISLQEVQFALAMEYGFSGWADLKKHVISVSNKKQIPNEEMIAMKVKKVGYPDYEKDKQTAMLILCDIDEKRFIPVYIGIGEARSIAAELQGVPSGRPTTHDLFSKTVEAFGGEVCGAAITRIENSTFIARLRVKSGEQEIELDSRPSDAIAMAIRFDAPILASKKMVQEVSVGSVDKAAPNFHPIMAGDGPSAVRIEGGKIMEV